MGQLYERWDGKGIPNGLKGVEISQAVRIVSVIQDYITLQQAFGAEAALEKIRKRSGTAYEPRLVDALVENNAMLTRGLDELTWAELLNKEPAASPELSEAELEQACLVIADFADIKSPYSAGHSRQLAELVEAAARTAKFPMREIDLLRRAALLHDIGVVAVPIPILLKQG